MKINDFFRIIRFNNLARKLQCDAELNLSNMSLADELTLTIISFPETIKKNSKIFKNKYVCVDATIITMLYACYYMRECGVESQEELMRKCLLSLRSVYKIPIDELRNIWKNHLEYFNDLFAEQEDIQDLSVIAQKASSLFAYNLYYNSYIEFNSNTPSLILDFSKQMQIDFEARSYFRILTPIVQSKIDSKC